METKKIISSTGISIFKNREKTLIGFLALLQGCTEEIAYQL